MKRWFVFLSCVFLLSTLVLAARQVAEAEGWVPSDGAAFFRGCGQAAALISFWLASMVGMASTVRSCPFCRGLLQREAAASAADAAFSCPNCGQITRTKAPVALDAAGRSREG